VGLILSPFSWFFSLTWSRVVNSYLVSLPCTPVFLNLPPVVHMILDFSPFFHLYSACNVFSTCSSYDFRFIAISAQIRPGVSRFLASFLQTPGEKKTECPSVMEIR
jgi:hypothetical protein